MIDAGIDDPWNDQVAAAVGLFNQGDIVERPPFFYAATPDLAVWSATNQLAEELSSDELTDTVVIELDPEDYPPYGIITSQGCDVDEATRKPWLQVAPVFPASAYSDDNRWLAEIQRGSVPHLILLTPPGLKGEWVADLRIEVPVEKSWLVGRAPIEAFDGPQPRREFALRLAGRLERPALPDLAHTVMVRPLRRWLDKRGTLARENLTSSGAEFRAFVEVADDGGLVGRLLVVGRRGPVPAETVTSITDWWDGRSADAPDGVVLLGCRVGTTDDFTMEDYLSSVLIDDRFLEMESAA